MKLPLLAQATALLAFVASALAGELEVIKTVSSVDCPKGRAQNGDTLALHYKGYLSDGTEFDNTHARHRPYHFVLGSGRVIKGWEQGLVGMCVGDKWTLIIPPELAYGEKGLGPIPGGETLKFETQLEAVYKPEEGPDIYKLQQKAFQKAAEEQKKSVKDEL